MMSNASKSSSKGSRFSRFMKAPIRVLIKARDFYIKSMTECSTRFDYGGMAMGCPTAQVPSALPRSFSTGSVKSSSSNSNNDDYRELIRAASARSAFAYSKNMEDLGRKQQISSIRGADNAMMMNRSHSVGIGRIDENKACEFGEEDKINKNMFPRSRSSAIARRTTS